jgi:hypothetical protein
MSEQPSAPQPAAERCICRDVADHLKELLLPRSEAAREHLRNSRIEFLKAIRSLLDERIAHLSATGQPQGTKVPVE